MRRQPPKFIIDPDFEEKVRKSFYDEYYVELTDEFVAWRNFAAVEKAKTILELCDGQEIERVVDVGAGLCDTLFLLNKSNFGSEYYVLEVSPNVIQFIRSNVNIYRLKAVYLLDTNNTPFPNNFYDLGILSHVLEHVPNPTKLLRETLRICKYVVVEVPLENCLISNLYEGLYEKLTQRKRKDNRGGHIHFFTKTIIKNLIKACNANLINERNYRLREIFPKKSHLKNMLLTIRYSLFYVIFRITGSKIVATNYSVLISSIHSTNNEILRL